MMRSRYSAWIKTLRETSRSACSATVPAKVFSMGMTAPSTEPRSTRSKTSADRAHGTTVHRGSIRSAASWLKEPNSPWIATFICKARYLERRSQGKSFLRGAVAVQVFLQHQRVHTIGVVSRPSAEHVVAVPLIKSQGREIVHRSFQTHSTTSGRVQTFFGGLQQSGTHSGAASRGIHINGDDVTSGPATGNDEPLSFSTCVIKGNEGKRRAMTNVGLQFLLGIGDACRKAGLIHAP